VPRASPCCRPVRNPRLACPCCSRVRPGRSEAFDYERALSGVDSIDPEARTIASYKLAEALAHLPTRGRVAEGGCGEGRFLRAIARIRPELQLVGRDVSHTALHAAQAQAPALDLRHVECVALAAADNEFDGLLLLDALEHASDPAALLGEAERILKPERLACPARETFGLFAASHCLNVATTA